MYLRITKDGVVEQDAEEHQPQRQNLGPGEISDAQKLLLPWDYPRGISSSS